MREIKFRVWDEESKNMYYGYNAIVTFSGAMDEVYIKNKNTVYELIDYKLMQYTGLKDINGKEIYEGDIVKIEFDMFFMNFGLNDYVKEHGNKYEFIGEVKYYDGAFHIDNNKDEGYDLFREIDPIEVIGNIYENANLLEK